MITIDHSHWQQISKVADTQEFLKSVEYKIKSLISELPMFQLEQHRQDTLQHQQLVYSIQSKYTDIVLLGTGGSSLGAQVFYKFCENPKLKFHFLDNIDPITFQNLLAKLDLTKTLFLVISKSGNTPETITQTLSVVEHLNSNINERSIQDCFLFMSEPKPSPLRQLASQLRCQCIDVPSEVGGRFSALSITGLLPAMIMGLNTEDLLKGAQHTLTEFNERSIHADSFKGATLIYQLVQNDQRNQVVLMPYVDELEPLGRWWRQLWAESLGKEGRGTTPIQAMGTVDQHSQLQLYLDGPDNKIYTLLLHPLNIKESTIPPKLASSIGAGYIAGCSMGDLLQAEQIATLRVLQEANRPTRTIQLSGINETTLGALMMHLILETLISATIMDVNAFDQPAVEAGKVYAKQFLTNNKTR